MRSSTRPRGKVSAARLFKSGSQPLYFRALLCALLGCAALYLGAVEAQILAAATPPAVSSVTRANNSPTTPNTLVSFTVTFSETVSGVDATDFALTTTNLSGAQVTSISGSGATRLVTVNTGSLTGASSGVLRLDITDDDTIVDDSGNKLGGAGAHNGDFTSGESYTVNKADQTIAFGALSSKTFGDADFGVTASATSGLAVSFSSSGNCTVTGSTVHITGAGSCTIRASQAGDSNFNAATPVDQTFNVARAASTTDVATLVNPAIPGQSVTFNAAVLTQVAMPTGTVQFKVDGNNLGGALNCVAQSGNICVAQVSTTNLTLGTHTVTADYSGDSNFSASSGLGGQTVAASVIEFAQPIYTVAERAGSILITIRRRGDDSGAASVDYQTENRSTPSFSAPCSSPVGFASERCDYTRAAGTLQFAPGETLKGFTVLVNDDSYVEGKEMVFLRLSNAVGSALIGHLDNNLEITDDEPEFAGNPIDDD